MLYYTKGTTEILCLQIQVMKLSHIKQKGTKTTSIQRTPIFTLRLKENRVSRLTTLKLRSIIGIAATNFKKNGKSFLVQNI